MSGRPLQDVNGGQILTLGILSLVCCGVFGPFAWIQGNAALAALDYDLENRHYYESERGLVVARRICGIIGTGLLVLGLIGAGLRVLVENGGH